MEQEINVIANELRRFVNKINAPIFGIDVDGLVNEWNDKTADITGILKAEAFDKPLVDTYVAPQLRESVQNIMKRALKGDETCNFELEFYTKSNEIRYLLVDTISRRNAENKVVGVYVVAQDLTETKKHAGIAKELQNLIDSVTTPIFGLDIHGNVNEWNDKTAEITGFNRDEVISKPLISTLFTPKFEQPVRDILKNALQGMETGGYKLELRSKSDEVRCLDVNINTRRDAGGNIVGVVVIAEAVSEAFKYNQSFASMAHLFDAANAPIIGVDHQGNINEWNKKAEEITGFAKLEAFGKPLVSLSVPSKKTLVQEVIVNAASGNETSSYELELKTKSEEICYLLINATACRDTEGNLVGVVGIAQDVTNDRKWSEERQQMQHVQDTKVETERNMTAYFAHELRNPLYAIDSALNSMPNDLPDTTQSLVDGMQLCTKFMSSVMNNLLDVRKMEEGKMQLSSAPISLEQVLVSIHRMMAPSVRPGVQFLTKNETSKRRNWVLGDMHRIQQVLTNVITNAIKYTTRGSIVLKMGWEDDGMLCFRCADTGPGIPKSEQNNLFQRFVQRGGAPGTGLGLAIAKHLVDLTGGSICFESDPAVEPGTTCIIKMPLPVCSPHELIIQDVSVSVIEDPLRVLLIDDIAMNRTMLKHRIHKRIAPNATIVEASTGEEGLEIYGEQEYDVIIVDQNMEEAGGILVGTDVVFTLRRLKCSAIIVGCSGNEMDEFFEAAGCDLVWRKPIPSNETIVQQLRMCLMKKNKTCNNNNTGDLPIQLTSSSAA